MMCKSTLFGSSGLSDLNKTLKVHVVLMLPVGDVGGRARRRCLGSDVVFDSLLTVVDMIASSHMKFIFNSSLQVIQCFLQHWWPFQGNSIQIFTWNFDTSEECKWREEITLETSNISLSVSCFNTNNQGNSEC